MYPIFSLKSKKIATNLLETVSLVSTLYLFQLSFIRELETIKYANGFSYLLFEGTLSSFHAADLIHNQIF